MRPLVRSALLGVLVVVGSMSPARAQSMISQTTASRYGLTRAWYAQVGSQQVTGTLAHVNYDEGMLLVQSSRGMLTAVDGETGRTLWATQVGARDRSSSEPAANDKYVVVLNGSSIYVVNRADGSIQWQRQVIGAPGAGPGVSRTHAFVPMISGLIEAYDLAKGAKQTPWNYQSSGRVLTPPMTTELSVSWTTERGYFYVADPAAGGIRYRLETGDEIHSRPGSWSPRLFAGSADGYVYAINEKEGGMAWKFPVGEAIYQPPVAIESRVFVVTQFGGMYCLDAVSGDSLWHVANVGQFMAASPSRVYASNRTGGMSIFDIRGGALLGKMPLAGITTKVVNSQSDRIFLVSENCVIQCLHEPLLASAVVYTPPPAPKLELKLGPGVDKAQKPAAAPADEPAAEKPAKGDAPEMPAEDEKDPFGDAPRKPAAAEKDPFGDNP
ncbi:MAG: PQQ-binding-like beta-propeller repeat protein [Pirellulales bacterium]